MPEFNSAPVHCGDTVPDWEPVAGEDFFLFYCTSDNSLYHWNGAAWSNLATDRLDAAWPVGAVMVEVTGTNPADTFGFGTWVAFGAGQVPVGFASGDSDFGTVEATGGEKTHQLTTTEMPAHGHTLNVYTTGSGTAKVREASGSGSATSTAVQNTGGDSSHNNLQPFIVVYMWKRTA